MNILNALIVKAMTFVPVAADLNTMFQNALDKVKSFISTAKPIVTVIALVAVAGCGIALMIGSGKIAERVKDTLIRIVLGIIIFGAAFWIADGLVGIFFNTAAG